MEKKTAVPKDSPSELLRFSKWCKENNLSPSTSSKAQFSAVRCKEIEKDLDELQKEYTNWKSHPDCEDKTENMHLVSLHIVSLQKTLLDYINARK